MTAGTLDHDDGMLTLPGMSAHQADSRPDPGPRGDHNRGPQPGPEAGGGRSLPAAARRALAEAEARRAAAARTPAGHPADRRTEVAGRAGPDPVRYGDWEVKGIASDF